MQGEIAWRQSRVILKRRTETPSLISKTTKKFGKLINAVLNPLGLHLSRPHGPVLSEVSFDAMAHRLARRSIEINTVIDVGASDGRWSRKLEAVYPRAEYLLIEANAIHKKALKLYSAERQNVDYTLAVAGDVIGEIYFDDTDPMGGIASHDPLEASGKTFPCTTVDSEIASRGLKGPFLLKLDTHGFEVPILKGAEQVLRETNLAVIEVYNFNLTGQSLVFWEMCQLMKNRGLRPLDILDPMFRPKDGAFWQIDMVFARDARPEFDSVTYD